MTRTETAGASCLRFFCLKMNFECCFETGSIDFIKPFQTFFEIATILALQIDKARVIKHLRLKQMCRGNRVLVATSGFQAFDTRP
ncbi:hypothetical protein C0081_17510 [Cohaesibacter celericrescens]|uniref:Uncharacterized protein n=1 Tax=Cohaesibacter celericrescens TaxID=2067669 RepID=A0A2N5XN90_9HYPH|nr:hypothetical protein C0081_17510 [Cohaesibacter celericrescens]